VERAGLEAAEIVHILQADMPPSQSQNEESFDREEETSRMQSFNRGDEATVKGHSVVIDPDMKWPSIQSLFGQAGKPVVNNRGSSANPFGATYFFGYRDIIFEVMRNNHIASVCIFNNT